MRSPASTNRLPEALGIVITVLSALALALVLAQILTLGREAGIDRNALLREQIAATETHRVLATVESIEDYRYALMLRTPRIAPARTVADARLRDLRSDFSTGDASIFGLRTAWLAIDDSWSRARVAAPGPFALTVVGATIENVTGLLADMEDASGVTYDPSVTTQNLADVYMQQSVFSLVGTRRLRDVVDSAIREGGLTLAQRLDAAGHLTSLRDGYDLTRDDMPSIASHMSRLIPERPERWNRLPVLAIELSTEGNQFVDLVTNGLMLTTRPALTPAQVDALASRTISAARELNRVSGEALTQDLLARGHVQAQRNRYLYLAAVLGAVLLVGVMLTIAQFIARRDRALLKDALRESARLQAELARQEAEEALRLTEAQFRAVFDGATIGIAIVDRMRALLDANDVYRTMFGDSIESALGDHLADLDSLWKGERDTFEFEQHFRSPSGQEGWADATVSIVMDEQRHPRFAICMFRDKTALKHTERRIQHDKTHDGLTGLPNRALFEDRLRGRFEEASALLDSFFAVLFVDLEHFKEINESLGHAAGDLALTQIAGRLRSSVDARDVVSRVGGDEFAVLLQSLGDILHVESVARRILNNLSKAITIGNRSVFLGSSVGIALWSSNYERAEDVMRDAEIAMQHAKSSGGARYALFDSTMHDRAEKRLLLISDLRLGIDRQEFRVLYQPIVNITDGRPIGCEALIRWDHPLQGTLGPSEFIPLAEQTGVANVIGRFVLQSACEQLGVWRRNRGGALDFSMHVNVSPSELSDPDFERTLVQIVEHHGLTPSDFTLEITESVVLDEGTRANHTIERVRNRGFKICIDDFGTGYSSLRYLQQFEVDAIKIDRSFVAGQDGELASEPIVRTLITLAEAYNVRIVAEGVETEDQRAMLRNGGCRLAQGFYFAVPLAAAELVERYPDVLGRVARSASA